jgi:hypothetical protein
MTLVPVKQLFLDLLAASAQAASGAAGPLHTTFMGLYIAPTPLPSFTMAIGDIVEAGFTGYARQAVVWGPPYISQSGLVAMDSASLHWQPSDAVAPQTVTGIFLASLATLGTLKAAMQLDNPVALPDAFHLMDVIVRFALDPTGHWGDGSVTC